MAVGAGALSVFDLDNGALTNPQAVRVGFVDERVYAPGGLGRGRPRLVENSNPGSSHFEYRDDIISVDQRGDMYLYEGDGEGHLREPRPIGWGWTGYRVIPAGDLTGDHNIDLLAIDPNGYLKLYRGDGKGGFLSPYPQVGWGWIGFDLYSAGDLTQDGRNDILSVDPGGILTCIRATATAPSGTEGRSATAGAPTRWQPAPTSTVTATRTLDTTSSGRLISSAATTQPGTCTSTRGLATGRSPRSA